VAKSRSALKRIRIAEKRRKRNSAYKSMMKTAIKRFEEALRLGNHEKIEATFRKAMRLIDKITSKGVIHPNKRDRKKAQLARKFNEYLQTKANAS